MTATTQEHHTATVLSARDDARGQTGRRAEAMPYLPASSSPYVPAGVDPDRLVWAETVAGGNYTHRVVARGTHLRLDDVEGTGCAHLLLFNALEPGERLNVADTMKIPWQAYLGAGHPLLSGDGRVLATVLADDSGHHDGFCGSLSDAAARAKYGASAPQSASPSGRALFTLAAAKHGLTPRDLPPSVSFFQGVRVDADGTLTFTGSAGPGRSVELVAELPLLVLIATSPHPLDPRPGYTNGPLRVHAWRGEPTTAGDPRWDATPEIHRAYLNTADYLTARGL
ncbi:urea amidolyase associated protein UAAP1 [Raineyella sp. W15-4]|uniref:urea amidolyase associated protein UAAP1 n=1 Tax=Raineyella sp. W15-4 TaxID=3081651 RepID=UPI002953E3AF|nr:urea amidolyase associated protein UAAP1 [Raineyella sp. W15-4]WOQ17226.1 urea carboxylase-associated family protein [Raineyella sp. W15-4]